MCSVCGGVLYGLKFIHAGLPNFATQRDSSMVHSATTGSSFHCMRCEKAHSVHGRTSIFPDLAMLLYVLCNRQRKLLPVCFEDVQWPILRQGVQVWFADSFSFIYLLTISRFIFTVASACFISFFEYTSGELTEVPERCGLMRPLWTSALKVL